MKSPRESCPRLQFFSLIKSPFHNLSSKLRYLNARASSETYIFIILQILKKKILIELIRQSLQKFVEFLK